MTKKQPCPISFPAPVEFDFSANPPAQAEFTKDLDDCTVADLEYLIDWRRKLSERSSVEHSDRCNDETRVLQRIVDAMRAHGASVVRDLTPDTPI